MYNILIVLILIIAVLLILVIMVQNPKGGGLDSSFGGGNSQLGGVQNTNKFLDKTTWVLAGSIAALIILSNIMHQRPNTDTLINTDGIVVPTQVDTPAPATAEPTTNTETKSDTK